MNIRSLSALLTLSIGLNFTHLAYAENDLSDANLNSAAEASFRAGTAATNFEKFSRSAKHFYDFKNHKHEKLVTQKFNHADLFNLKNKLIKNNKEQPQKNLWSLMDPETAKADGVAVQGTATDRAYEEFRLPRKKATVVVAVIDSGVDINHPDLKDHIWQNPNLASETKYKGAKNGWNFLGNSKGQNVNGTTLEVTRELIRLRKLRDQGKLDTEALKAQYDNVQKEYNKQYAQMDQTLKGYTMIKMAIGFLKAKGYKDETPEGFKAFVMALPADTEQDTKLMQALKICARLYMEGKNEKYVDGVIAEEKQARDYHFNLNFDSSSIVGDNPEIMNDVYGNPDVMGADPMHGTHVSGIIAAVRDNDFGINGQAANVLIMPIRAVPNGDERDKDIGNAIRFAVDHGADIINMSFGKPFSPQKWYVDEAVAYAENKGVLMVHAAGNDAANNDSYADNFPNSHILDKNSGALEHEATNWIEVGASSVNNSSLTLAADFSNFGKKSVDLFAPGVDIVSTLPGDSYGSLDGTSMASPEVAGVAALVWNRFPKISAPRLKLALMNGVTKFDDSTMVYVPSEDDTEKKVLRPFNSLSRSGGILNAYQALHDLKDGRVLGIQL